MISIFQDCIIGTSKNTFYDDSYFMLQTSSEILINPYFKTFVCPLPYWSTSFAVINHSTLLNLFQKKTVVLYKTIIIGLNKYFYHFLLYKTNKDAQKL